MMEQLRKQRNSLHFLDNGNLVFPAKLLNSSSNSSSSRPASIASPDWKLSDSFVRGSPRPSDGQRIWATQRPLSMSGLLFPPEEIDRIARYKLYRVTLVVAHLGWVDLDLVGSSNRWAATAATYILPNSTKPRCATNRSPCRDISTYLRHLSYLHPHHISNSSWRG